MGQTGPGKGVNVIEKRGEVLESILQIDKARLDHGGRYTCGPTLGISDTVTVHIIAGEQTEAIHVNSAVRNFQTSLAFLEVLLLLLGVCRIITS